MSKTTELLSLIPVRNPDTLSRRERQVAELISRGATNAQIAAMLGTSVQTVKNQVHSIMMKLGLRTRLELALAVRSHPEIVSPLPYRTGRPPNWIGKSGPIPPARGKKHAGHQPTPAPEPAST